MRIGWKTLDSQNITYIVSGNDGTGWSVKGRSRNQDTAFAAAERLHKAKAFLEVRVEKQFADRSTGREVRTTILTRARRPSAAIPAWLWILVAFAAGLASFFATYWVLER